MKAVVTLTFVPDDCMFQIRRLAAEYGVEVQALRERHLDTDEMTTILHASGDTYRLAGWLIDSQGVVDGEEV